MTMLVSGKVKINKINYVHIVIIKPPFDHFFLMNQAKGQGPGYNENKKSHLNPY